jgi:hypothetical protein
MTHPTLEELTLMAHDLMPRGEHLDGCAACHRLVALLEGELALFRRAERRIDPPRTGGQLRWSRGIPIAAAAGVLFAVVWAIVSGSPWGSHQAGLSPQETPAGELVRRFLEGTDPESAQAKKDLRARGAAVLPDLVHARLKHPETRRIEPLRELILELKEAAASDPGKLLLKKLREIRITIDMQKAPLTAIVDYLREISSVNFVIDPGMRDPEVDELSFKIQNVTLATCLDRLLEQAHLDFDVRSGVVLVAPEGRLWAPPPAPATPIAPLSEEEGKAVRALIARLGSDSPEDRDRASSELQKLGLPVLPILEETAKGGDPEVAGRCRSLIEELCPWRSQRSIPRVSEWRRLKDQANATAVVRKLESMKIDLAFENTKREDILSFVQDFSGLKIVVKGKFPAGNVTIKVKDLALGDVLELFTLPLGWDVRIVDDVVELLERKP